MTLEELTKKVEEVETRAAEKQAKDLEEKRTNTFYNGDNFKMNNKETRNQAWQEIANAMIEKRALSIDATLGHDTANGIGAINQIADLWDLIKQREPLLDAISYFNGPNFETQIPVLEARPAVPTDYAETASKSGAVDSKTKIAVKKINPKTYFSVLPITYEAARQSFVGLEARIPGLLAESFRTAMCNLLFDVLFDDDNVWAGAVGDDEPSHVIEFDGTNGIISIADLEKLALAVLDTDIANPVIVMNPDVYAKIASTDGDVYDFLKEELVRNKTVEGVKVILTGKAPKAYKADGTSNLSAGDIAVWAGDLKNFAMGVADQITIEPIKQLGDSNTYYQAIAAFDGIVVQPKNVFGLGKASV